MQNQGVVKGRLDPDLEAAVLGRGDGLRGHQRRLILDVDQAASGHGAGSAHDSGEVVRVGRVEHHSIAV